LTSLVVLFLLGGGAWAAAPGTISSLTPRQRYGFVANSPNWSQSVDVASLRAGWYVSFTEPTCTAVEGMAQAQGLRTYAGQTVNPDKLGALVDSYPGILWLIGNEPDCIWQDNVVPEEYARIYHDMYTFIKDRDPSSQVSPGGIVQPTPLRLEYLDRVLAAYQDQYGQAMPVDVWNIHTAILNEEQGGWGADIPPGLDATAGVIRGPGDNDNMTIFAEQIGAFRQWMADRGYGGYPLVVTEYGILMPDDLGFGPDRVNAFMSATFDFMETASDPLLGDPDDGYHLVQRWAWFSLDVPPWDPITGAGFNGNLYDPDTWSITAFGQHYASRTSGFSALAYTDLTISAVQVTPTNELAGPGQAITRSLEIQVANSGTLDAGSMAVRLSYDGPLSGTLEATLPGLPAGSAQWVPFTLTHLPAGRYSLSATVDPGQQVTESLECNNDLTTMLLAPSDQIYLPTILRQGTPAAGQGQASARPAVPVRYALDKLPPSTFHLSHSSFQPPTSNLQSPTSTIREFAVPTSYPAQIVIDADGGVWISERDGNEIARFDPQTETWEQYSIDTADSQPWGIDLDAAGTVWFAETAADKIGKLDPATSIIVEYELEAGSEPWGVSASNGVIWFTERAANRIGKLIVSTGAITEYPLPTANAEPAGIDAGGGYVWFSEAAADQIGRLTIADGSITERAPKPPRPALDEPRDIVITSAGNPWFTETAGNKITLYYIGSTTDFYQHTLYTSNSEPYGLALQGNTAVWFTERAGNKLGRYTGHNPPYEYSLPAPNHLPTDIAIDGDGCAWYTAPGTDQIGQYCLILQRAYLPQILRNTAP
jgi:streptogramin lyase